MVIGSGMAGARTVEEILGGGGDQFNITVFGDEPCNYNRIQLSNVLAGSETPDAIYLNTVDWYRDNGIDLRARVRVVRIDSYAKTVFADDGSIVGYDKLIIATGSVLSSRRSTACGWTTRLWSPGSSGSARSTTPPR